MKYIKKANAYLVNVKGQEVKDAKGKVKVKTVQHWFDSPEEALDFEKSLA